MLSAARSRVLRMAAEDTSVKAFPSRPREPRGPRIPLMQPLNLYRLILRTHRHKLPAHLRAVGDPYVKSEFHLHKTTDNPIHIVGFLTEWQKYVQDLQGDGWRGVKIDKEKVDKMSEEQLGQLYELMQAARDQMEAKEIDDAHELIDKITSK